MNISEFTLRIILIFIPGIVTFLIIDRLTPQEERKIHNILIYSLVLGFLCYCFYYLIIILLNLFPRIHIEFSFFNALVSNEAELNFNEIILVTILSVLMGYIIAWLNEKKFLYKVAGWLGISNISGGSDVFSAVLNKDEIEWIRIRDIENDLMYEGLLNTFSESGEIEELYLEDVTVYRSSTHKELYILNGLYLNRKTKDLILEFPQLVEENKQ